MNTRETSEKPSPSYIYCLFIFMCWNQATYGKESALINSTEKKILAFYRVISQYKNIN